MRHVARALDFFFGCHHSNLTRVFMIGRHSYRVCCDCGVRFDYSLDTMSMRKRDFSSPEATAPVVPVRGAHS